MNFVPLHVIKRHRTHGSIYIRYNRADITRSEELFLSFKPFITFVWQPHPPAQPCREARQCHFSQELPPVSVIICAREECENLRRNLKAVLEQDYPGLRLSSSMTETLTKAKITSPCWRNTRTSTTALSPTLPAISAGKTCRNTRHGSQQIRLARLYRNQLLPQSNQWLRLLARNFTSRTQVVWDTAAMNAARLAAQARSVRQSVHFHALPRFALAGSPYMGIGRNLVPQGVVLRTKGFSTSQPSTRR